MTKRKSRLAAEIDTYIDKVGRAHGRAGHEPNDRKYDKKIAELVRRMDPVELDEILGEHEDPEPGAR
jgi:hypothetical protein